MIVTAASILVCTHNRADSLRGTLSALLTGPRTGDYTVEIVVVDNNSGDHTRAVVEAAASTCAIPVRYLFEPRQGKSFALNLGLSEAGGDIVAHTDDDVIPETSWLDRIVDAFRRHDVTFAFGKVLPRWGVLPPPELLLPRAHQIWGPLALLDYGDEARLYEGDAASQRLPVGANLAFHRATLRAIGGWRTDLGKVDNSLISGEDHEVFFRLKAAGLFRGLYDPSIVVRHFVPSSRLTRQYFRRWFYWHGKTLARMPEQLYGLDLAAVPHVFGVPRFLYRQALQAAWGWARTLGGRDSLGVLIRELECCQFAGFFAESWELQRVGSRRTAATADMPAPAARMTDPTTTSSFWRSSGS
ncbi:MAG: glycosyltransferase [Acidobacteria bacterium]|nr:MAG: glycosyltransferase [Acidobacteriota bacterium]